MSKLRSVKAVLEKIGVENFQSIKSDNVVEFVSNIPNMSKEVAFKCIEQFPVFKDFVTASVSNFNVLSKSAIEKDPDFEESIAAMRQAMDIFAQIAEKDNITESDRRYCMENIVEITRTMHDMLKEKIEFKQFVMKAATFVATVGIVATGSLIGLKTGFKLPKKP